jgi:hypothetical protein
MPKSIAEKLLIKPGNRVAVLPPESVGMPPLGELPDGAELTKGERDADVVLFFFSSQAEQEARQTGVIQGARPGAIVWFISPKKSGAVQSDLSRDVVWKTLEPTGWRPVTNISVDDTWSALRMRPTNEVGR